MENEEKRPREKSGRRWIKYLVTAAVGLVMALAVLGIRGAYSGDIGSLEMAGYLSDAFFIPGILITGFGCLVFVSSEGAFDGLVYGLKLFVDKFRFGRLAREYELESFGDYKARKAEKGKPSFGFMIIVGLAFLAISAVFLLRYMSLEA